MINNTQNNESLLINLVNVINKLIAQHAVDQNFNSVSFIVKLEPRTKLKHVVDDQRHTK